MSCAEREDANGPFAPSGRQLQIAYGQQHATIVEVGGGIREYGVGGRPVLEPYPLEAMCDGAHGAPLIPWPNRLADGRYAFDGEEHQLPLSEPERHNAIHGLLRWRSWSALELGSSRVVMGAVLMPQPGYPFALRVQIAYELGEEGLVVTTRALNIGPNACPFAAGQHPYLSPGDGLIDDCTLHVPAGGRILTDPRRMLPTEWEPLDGTDCDFRRPRRIGSTEIDSAFTDLERDSAGRATVRLAGRDGARAELWLAPSYAFAEIYTGDGLADERRRRGLGVEPMTAPPNAFRSREGLLRLEPGGSVTLAWGARLSQS